MNQMSLKWIPKKSQLYIILLVGLLLLVIAIPTTHTQNDDETVEDTKTQETVYTSSASYETMLEKKLTETLEAMDGVGNVSVMITLKSSEENVIASDKQSSTSKSSQGSGSDTVESSETTASSTSIYHQNTDGSQTPYVSKQVLPKVEGVVVLADGADNGVVVENITTAVQALFGIEVHKIKVVKRTHS